MHDMLFPNANAVCPPLHQIIIITPSALMPHLVIRSLTP